MTRRMISFICFLIAVTLVTGSTSEANLTAPAPQESSRRARYFLYADETFPRSAECEGQERNGICYGEVTCRRLKGKVIGYCSGLQGACCVFERSCGGKTKQIVSHFQNGNYPLKQRLPETCNFSLHKRDSSYCGLRLEIDMLDLPGQVGRCTDTFLWISGVPGRSFELICGHFEDKTAKTYDFNITEANVTFLRFKSYSRFKAHWKIAVKQLLCSEFSEEVLPQNGDGGSGSLVLVFPTTPESTPSTTISTTTSTTTTTTTTSATTSATTSTSATSSTTTTATTTSEELDEGPKCGRKGSMIGSQDVPNTNCPPSFRLQLLDIFSSKVQQNVLRMDRHVDGDTKGRDNSIEWDVPDLKDTYLYKVLGSPSIIEDRITYGKLAIPGELAWQAAIKLDGRFHCGASIISDQFLITAGHCVNGDRSSPRRLKVILGDWDLENPCDLPSMEVNVRYVVVHPDYSRFTLRHDIALVKLTRKIHFTSNIQPICLPEKDWQVEGKIATVSGWGKDQRNRLAPKLKKLDAAVITNKECGKRWTTNGVDNSFIVESMLCMDSQNGDSCNGDSGGPCVIEEPEGSKTYKLAGVVSFGSGSCVDITLPGVYTRVSYYVDWIQREMER